MGFFSEIVDEARRGQPRRPAPQAFPPPVPAPGPSASAAADGRRSGAPVRPAAQAAPSPQPKPEPQPKPQPKPEPQHEPEPTSGHEPPSMDLTADAGATEEARRKQAHEAAEAKRKAEWDAKQAEKKAARQKQLDGIAAMDGAELLKAATGRVAVETERLTRRNMKEAVAEHVQARCREDAAFARLVMDPAKSMVHCFRYINRQSQKYAEQEMKDNGVQRTGVYGLDVPDGLCYQWAEDYFRDPDAKEDRADEEKFVPKPYVPASKAPKGKAKKPEEPKDGESRTGKSKAKAPKAEKPKGAPVMEQMSLM